MKRLDDSVIDFPHETLCEEVWQINSAGEFELTNEATEKIQKLVDHMCGKFKIPNCVVFITGSITSNSYADDSDVDVHFHSDKFKVEMADDFNKLFRGYFDEHYKLENDIMIGSHPLEVYFQANPYQDYMSVGCYSFTDKKWLVGPDLKDTSFNPMSEYYKEIQANASKFTDEIYNVIMTAYEKAVVLNNMIDHEHDEIYESIMDELDETLEKATDLFKRVAQSRKVMSQPTSIEQALEMRNSRTWKIADATFKMMNEYGYLTILKKLATISDLDDRQKVDSVLSVVHENL